MPSGTRALIDRGRLEPALDAVVDNAVRHTRSGDEIALWAADGPTRCRIRVTDAGEGIAADEIERAVDRFHRGELQRGRSDPDSGFGLGLALVLPLWTPSTGVHSVRDYQ